jgi:predicted GNAT family acetyltransferase
MITTRILQPGDQAQLEAFLVPRVASSMFLLSNSRKAGMIEAPGRYHGTYAGAFDGGALVGAVAHYWNGIVMLQAPPEHAATLADLALRGSQRPFAGVVGPSAQVAAVLSARDLKPEALRSDSEEDLFALSLAELRVPAALTDGSVTARSPVLDDLDLLVDLSVAFDVETMNDRDTPDLRARRRIGEESGIAEGTVFLLEQEGRCVATSGFNADTAEAVQVGGVYTLPALRGKGFARAIVAHSLLAARARGVPTAFLFTGKSHHAAQRAYQSLGFERIGDFRISLLG